VPDVVTSEVRSRMMAGIKGQNTNPEMIIRKGLYARGFRFRLHEKKLPGKPDLVFSKYKAVIFVDGCFWHGHECHLFKWPKSRQDFWRKKIMGNVERDNKVRDKIENLGWRHLTVWECAIKGRDRIDPKYLLDSISDWLIKSSNNSQIAGKHGTC
jgi:DNA mismatch endonuclease (patch repair protein)